MRVIGRDAPERRIRHRAQRHEGDRRRDRRELRAATGEQRRENAVHLAGDGRPRHRDQAILAVPVGDEIDVAGLVRHRHRSVLREIGIEPFGFPEDQARMRVVPDDVGAIGIDRVALAE